MMGNTATSVVLYTDQPFLAEGMASVLGLHPSFRLDLFSHSFPEIVEFVKQNRPGIVVLDLTEELNLSHLRQLKQAESRCRIALWAYKIAEELAFHAMQAGVRGILRKWAPIDSFFLDLEAIRDGELRFENELLEGFLSGTRVVLTPREGQLIAQMVQGLKNKEIAHNLGICEGTVKVYLSRLFKKLGVNDRFELALFGLKSLQGGPVCGKDRGGQDELDTTSPNLRALRTVLVKAGGKDWDVSEGAKLGAGDWVTASRPV